MVVALMVTVVCDGTTVVALVVTLSALTGSTMRSIARNTATGMTEDPLSRDIEKSCQMDLPVINVRVTLS
jgi:hypothetical protein